MVLNAFESGIFPVKKPIQVISTCLTGTGIKLLLPKQIFRRLKIALAQ